MYLCEVFKGNEARKFAADPRPFGLAVEDDSVIASVSKIEHHGSSFSDAGKDFNLFMLFDENGNIISKIRIEGY
jgi:hypothetical protein